MAGSNPGMVIKVAADIAAATAALDEVTTDATTTATALGDLGEAFDASAFLADLAAAETALGDVSTATEGVETDAAALEAAVGATGAAYGTLEGEAVPALADVTAATEGVDTATGGVSTSVIALGAAIGTFAAEAAIKLADLAVSGVAALATGLKDIVLEGSDIADVASAFDRVTASVGLTADVLITEMQAGAQGTIDKFELMKTVNRDVNAGLRLSEGQYRTMTEAAFALANANGTDVNDAFKTVNDAMLTGRTRTLALQGVQVDLTAATKEYAEQHHIYGRELTETEKLEATRAAILDGITDATSRLGEQTAGLDERVQQASVAWADFKGDLGRAINESGVLQAGLDTLGKSLLDAFGGTKEQAIKTITRLVNDGAIGVLDLAKALVSVGEYGVRAMSVLVGPVDALMVAVSTLGERWAAFVAFLADTAAKIPGATDDFKAWAAEINNNAAAMRTWRDDSYNAMRAHDELAKGQGALFEVTSKAKDAITAAQLAMRDQLAASQALTPATNAQAVAEGAANEARKQSVQSAADLAKAYEEMDSWSLKIKNQNPLGFLLENLDKTKAKFIDTQATMDAWARNIQNLDETKPFATLLQNASYIPPVLDSWSVSAAKAAEELAQTAFNADATGQAAKFSAETIGYASQATLSWSEALEQVNKGLGTMTGTIGPATKPAGMSNMEFQQMQTDPRTWELLHGWDWQHAGGTGSTWAWLDQLGPARGGGGGTTTTQNINVNTVMGDKNEIARIVKEALANDWRTTGVRA